MAEIHNIKATLIQKCKSSDEWNDSRYVPQIGEIVIYSDLNKMKIGDGTTIISALPFVDSNIFGENGITKITDSLSVQGDQISGKKLALSQGLNINNSKATINSGGNISGSSVTVTGNLTSGQKVSGATAEFSSKVQAGTLEVTGKSTLGSYNKEESTAKLIVGCGTSSSLRENCFSTGKDDECYIKIGNTILTESMLSKICTFFESLENANDLET